MGPECETRWPGRLGPALVTVPGVVLDRCTQGRRTWGPQAAEPPGLAQHFSTMENTRPCLPKSRDVQSCPCPHAPVPWSYASLPLTCRRPSAPTENGSAQPAKTQGHGDNDSPASRVPTGGREVRASVARFSTAIVAAEGTWPSLSPSGFTDSAALLIFYGFQNAPR